MNLNALHLNLPLASFWFGDGASTMASDVDSLFDIITGIGIAFFVLIIGMMIVFMVKYRAREGHVEQPSPSHNNSLEILWSVIPTLLVILIFFLGFQGFLEMRTPPDDAYEVEVVAQKWNWTFLYPNGQQSSELHVPVDRPVKLIQSSKDVLHSLYIPAFRIKMDCVPGRYTYQWFRATEEGTFDLFCAEYCGTNHSNMFTKVIVKNADDFQKFLDTDIYLEMDPVEAGKLLYQRRGCSQCHSIDGTARVGGGPTFLGSFGTEQVASGETIVVDENYIRESILNPTAKVRAGYNPVMPSYQGQLRDEDISRIISFIKSLKDEE